MKLVKTSDPDPKNASYSRNGISVEEYLENLLTAFPSTDQKIILVGGTPEFPWNVPNSITRSVLFDLPITDLPLREHVVQRHRPSDDILSGVSSRTDHYFIPLWPIICDKTCPLGDEKGIFYEDDDHLSPHGALNLVLPILLESLAELELVAVN